MPQTEEEHLENESMEDDRSTKDPNDAEVFLNYVASHLASSVSFGVYIQCKYLQCCVYDFAS
jgi:hypothetical protein